jgi:tetratricopeptide (TPR) repeat protein
MPDEPVASSSTSSTARSVMATITAVSTVITIALSIGNYFLKQRFDEAEQRLKLRAQALDESRADIARFDYVYKLLSTVDKGTQAQQTLAVNVARLALRPEEQDTLFKGLAFSPNDQLASVGREGVAVNARSGKNDLGTAKARERDGFQSLLSGDFEAALKAFDDTEVAYPTYHRAYEIGRLLRKERGNFDNPATRKEILKKIVVSYPDGAPPDLLVKLKQASG